jgi:ATP/maltotriose-dependent transcriptional regulator MalT/DNA-binding SARP family transcriptional activator
MLSRPTSLAKTTRPRAADVLARERLFALLDQRRRSPVVWVCGPPGAGKTTLLASYLEDRGTTARWYQLDAGDADVGAFFYYMGSAVGGDGARPALELFSAEYRADLGAFSRRFFQALYASLEPPFALVLDNHHEVPARSDLHQVIHHAVAEMPPDGSLVVLSRHEPPASMARLRANRRLEAIGWSELRLTRVESDAIATRWNAALGPVDLEQLHQRTQGWAAGLVLMLDQGAPPGAAQPVADPQAPQVLFDYLAGEVFEALEASTRELLIETAVLPEFTAEMAGEVTGEPNAARLLAALHLDHRFVSVRPGDAGPVYQCHPMLRGFLLGRAAGTLPARRRRELRARAARALEEAGRVDSALALLHEVRDWRSLARLLERCARGLLREGRVETLRGALEALPETVMRDAPWLLYWLASCRFHEAPREARLLYAQAHEAFAASGDGDPRGRFLACTGAVDAILYELDDLALLDRWIAELDALVEAHGEPEDPDVGARLAASLFMALVFRQPWHPEIGTWAQRTYQRLDAFEDAGARLTAELLLAINLNYTGQFAKAREFLQGMQRLGEAPHVPPVALTVLKDVESMHYMLTADHERCVSTVYDGLEVARASGVHLWTFHLLSNGVAGALAAGDLATAHEFLERMAEHRATARRLDQAIYHYCEGWLATLAGEPAQAYQALRTALRLSVECGCPFYEILTRLALAPVCVECGDEKRAAAELRRVRSLARGIDNRLLEFSSLLGYAHLALAHGRQRSGLNALRYAMGVGREHGFRHFLGWRPEVMATLCERALVEGIETDYVRGLVRDRALTPHSGGEGTPEWPWPLRIQTFGGFAVLKDGEPLEQRARVQQRPMALLRALVGLGAQGVSESAIAGLLWPRIDPDSAHRSLTTTLFRLRRMLEQEGAVVLRHGRLSLDRRLCWLDVRSFELLAETLDETLDEAQPGGDAARGEAWVAHQARRLLDLYRGPFMASEADDGRYLALRERLRNRFLRCLGSLARLWESAGQPAQVVELYQRALEAEPLSESLYRRLMLCCRGLGRHAEAIEAYERCQGVLRAERGGEPSRETTAIYERIVAEL